MAHKKQSIAFTLILLIAGTADSPNFWLWLSMSIGFLLIAGILAT